MTMHKVKFMIKCILIVLVVILFIFFVSVFLSQNALSVTHYEYNNEKITGEFKIVQITDLHNHEFGHSNCRLVEKIAKEQPDIIFMTGDMLNEGGQDASIVETLIEELKEIAPVYFSLGNHEKYYMEHDPQLVRKLEEAGAIVLEKEYLDTEINDQEVRIGGVYGYVLDRGYKDGSEQRFMEEFQDTDRFKILLSHMPEGLLLWKGMETWDVDLIFSGHVHGGQVRIPFVGGLYDPEEGFFPTYTKGMFESGKGTMILSAGLGSSAKVLRVNNLPEIVVCQVQGNK